MSDYKIFVFDLETTGLPLKIRGDYTNNEKYNSSRMLEIGWKVMNETGEILKSENQYIIPEIPSEFAIHPVAASLNKLSVDIIKNKGITLESIADKLVQDIKECTMMIAHNAEFDVNILMNECHRRNLQDLLSTIKGCKVVCSKELFIQKFNGGRWKGSSLDDMYYFFFKEKRTNQHNTDTDTADLCRCVVKLNCS